jgi:glycine cleavage system H protein
VAVIGISAFAVQELRDLVFMELPETGRRVRAGEAFGVIESVKAVSDLYSPVSGEIVEVNSTLPDHLGVLHDDPYGKGWMIKIRMSQEGELGGLLSPTDYEKQCREEAH